MRRLFFRPARLRIEQYERYFQRPIRSHAHSTFNYQWNIRLGNSDRTSSPYRQRCSLVWFHARSALEVSTSEGKNEPGVKFSSNITSESSQIFALLLLLLFILPVIPVIPSSFFFSFHVMTFSKTSTSTLQPPHGLHSHELLPWPFSGRSLPSQLYSNPQPRKPRAQRLANIPRQREGLRPSDSYR